jgi:c-di-GMP-binding flagellar brake protein YcgR
MADPEAQQAHLDRPAERTEGLNRRAYPRYAVDCAAVVFPVSGSGQVQGRLSDLSLGGCRVAAEHRYTPGILVRVEVQFQLRGIAFRIVGVTVGSRDTKSFAIRFLDMSIRRRQELAEVLEEVANANATREAAQAAISETASAPAVAAAAVSTQAKTPVSKPILEQVAKLEISAGKSAVVIEPPEKTPEKAQPIPPVSKRPAERRSQSRHAVDTSAKLLLIKAAISMPGRILNLSLGGCRIRTEERFNVGIYVRVEAEFYLHGLPFRVGGVSQAILDKNTIGVKFLDMSERRREQLAELMTEIAEAAALEPAAGLTGIVDGAGQGADAR